MVAGAIVASAIGARTWNAFAYQPLADFDAAGHALNAFAFFEGRLPDPSSWSGFHPPLYYVIGAALWSVLPAAIPVHSGLRLLSAAAGFGALVLAWRALRRFVGRADAAVVAAVAAAAPVFAIATSMFGNETTCAALTTAALARLTTTPDPGDPRTARHFLITMTLATAAALAKSTGLLAVVFVGVALLWRGRTAPARAVRIGAIAALPLLLLLLPFYAMLMAHSGSWLAPISGAAVSPDARAAMAAQPPGDRRLSDYLSIPPATLLAPSRFAPGLDRSVPGLLYASVWADGHASFLPMNAPPVASAAALLAFGGLLPTGLAMRGVVVAWRRRRELAGSGAGWLFVFAGTLLAALLVQTWLLPRYSAVKASYLLPALLPFSLLLALGLDAARSRARAVLRGALLVYAAFAVAVTTWGWWMPTSSLRPKPVRSAPPDTPQAVVEAWFHGLGRDPLRLLPLLTDDAHRRHGLVPDDAPATALGPVPVDTRRVAWLSIQARGAFQRQAQALSMTPISARRHRRDRATVVVRVASPEAPNFKQRFLLVRARPDAAWRIDDVQQFGVDEQNVAAAFAAWPQQALRAQPESAALP